MPESVQQEKGHLYKKESPSFHKGETSKGVSISMGKVKDQGRPFDVGVDSYAQKLKKVWKSAIGAKSKFGNF
jgi:hypothetical protein